MYSRRLRLKGMPGRGRKGAKGGCYTSDVSAAPATRSPRQRRLFIVPSRPGTLAPIKTDHRIWAFSAPSRRKRVRCAPRPGSLAYRRSARKMYRGQLGRNRRCMSPESSPTAQIVSNLESKQLCIWSLYLECVRTLIEYCSQYYLY